MKMSDVKSDKFKWIVLTIGIDCSEDSPSNIQSHLMVEGGVLNINIPVSHIPSCWMSLSFTGVRTS